MNHEIVPGNDEPAPEQNPEAALRAAHELVHRLCDTEADQDLPTSVRIQQEVLVHQALDSNLRQAG